MNTKKNKQSEELLQKPQPSNFSKKVMHRMVVLTQKVLLVKRFCSTSSKKKVKLKAY